MELFEVYHIIATHCSANIPCLRKSRVCKAHARQTHVRIRGVHVRILNAV